MNVKIFLAIGCLTIALAAGCSKPSADALFAKGNEYFGQNHIPEAIVQYRLALQADPKRGDVHMKLSEAYMRERDLGAALGEALLAADLLPNKLDAQLAAGALLLLNSSFDDAKVRAQKALAIDPKSADAMVLMGNALAGLKDLDGAIEEFQEALVLNPSREQAYANIGTIQYSRGKVQEAEAAFRKAVAEAPSSISARVALAGFLWATTRPGDAEKVLKDALALEPTNLIVNRALGTFYTSTGRAVEAEPYFKTIAEATKTDAAQLAMADYYLMIRRLDDAEKILTPLSTKAETMAPASLRLAAIQAERNNRTAAGELVRAVLAKTPKYAPARMFEIRLLLAGDKLDEAQAAAKTLIKDEPNGRWASEANFTIGAIEASRDRTEQALEAYEEALRLQPQSPVIALALAQLHLRLGRPDKASTLAQQVLNAKPQDVGARVILVRADLMRHDVTKAAAGLASLEKEFPNSTAVLNLGAARDLATGRSAAARATYTKVVAADANDLEALEGLSMIDVRDGRKAAAVERIDAALKRIAPGIDLYLMAARVFSAAGELPRTEEVLKKAMDRSPAHLAAYGMLAQVYIREKRLDDARDQFQALITKNPKSVSANTMLGMVFEAKGDVAAAEAQYLKTLGIDPAAAVAANNLAWILASSNRNLDQAIQLAETALRSLPEEPHVNDTLGWAYYRKGMYADAARHLEQSLKQDATDPATYYHLGMTYLQLKDPVKAKAALGKALSMSATFEGADEARKALATLGR